MKQGGLLCYNEQQHFIYFTLATGTYGVWYDVMHLTQRIEFHVSQQYINNKMRVDWPPVSTLRYKYSYIMCYHFYTFSEKANLDLPRPFIQQHAKKVKC